MYSTATKITRLHLFWNMSLQKGLHIFSTVLVWVVNLNRSCVSHFICYLTVILGNIPESFRGETQHSASQISSKKVKELKNNLSSSDSILSMSTLASNVDQQKWMCVGPLEVMWSSPPAQVGPCIVSCPGSRPDGFWYLQGQRLHNFSS